VRINHREASRPVLRETSRQALPVVIGAVLVVAAFVLPRMNLGVNPRRDAGLERFFLPGKTPFMLEPKSPVLYYLQRLRDEAHRFAIGAHRQKRIKAIGSSPLDEIGGIGSARKKALLHHFGSARAVAAAGLADLERVQGISKIVAKKIYDHFHAEG